MDIELRSALLRYSFMGLVMMGAVLWTVVYVKDLKHENGPPKVLGVDAGPKKAESTDAPRAPSLADMFIEKNGEKHVACGAACRLEQYCSLRSVDDCLKTSCLGDVRVNSRSDPDFAKAEDCTAAAQAPCDEACFKRGECKHDHSDDARCGQSCLTLSKSRPSEMYRESRCVIETQSCDLTSCGAIN